MKRQYDINKTKALKIYTKHAKRIIKTYEKEYEEFYHLDLKKAPYTMEEIILDDVYDWFEKSKEKLKKTEIKAHEILTYEEKENIINHLLTTIFYPKWDKNYEKYKAMKDIYKRIETMPLEERNQIICLRDDKDPLNTEHLIYFPRPIRRMWERAGWKDTYLALHYYAVKWKGGENGKFYGWIDPETALKWDKYYDHFEEVYGDELVIERMFEWYDAGYTPKEALQQIKNGYFRPKDVPKSV